MNTIKNSVRLIGRLGADPEIITLSSGEKKANFNIATDRVYQDAKGEIVKETHWHRIVVFGKKVKFVEEFVTKGKLVGIEGRLSNRSYDASDGSKRFITEIFCKEIMLLSSPGTPVSNPFESAAEVNAK